jgi:hypothetical protein
MEAATGPGRGSFPADRLRVDADSGVVSFL